jgi:hypothetical protein
MEISVCPDSLSRKISQQKITIVLPIHVRLVYSYSNCLSNEQFLHGMVQMYRPACLASTMELEMDPKINARMLSSGVIKEFVQLNLLYL